MHVLLSIADVIMTSLKMRFRQQVASKLSLCDTKNGTAVEKNFLLEIW